MQFLEKIPPDIYALSDGEDNCGLLNEGILADLPLLILLAIPKSSKSLVSGKQFYFVLLARGSLVYTRTLLQRLLACLNFTLDEE